MKNKKGFTLVELIAIIIVIGLIIGILTPTAIRLIANSKKNAFREGMRSIVRSAEMYMEENNLKSLPEEGLFLNDEKLGFLDKISTLEEKNTNLMKTNNELEKINQQFCLALIQTRLQPWFFLR